MERDYAYHSARRRAHLDAPDDDRAARGRARGRAGRSRAGCGAGTMPIVFDPRVGASLVGHLIGAITGSAITRRTSFLLDALGTEVFAPGVTIRDDPHRPHGLRSRPFDGEGLPVSPCAIVEDGVLETWLLDSASARQLGLEPTGHAARGVGGAPGVGDEQPVHGGGRRSARNADRRDRRRRLVTELIGQGVNGVTGDYSRGAAGFLIENGEITRPVSEFTIAGNLKDMFRALTPANDLEFRYGVNVPTLRIDGMTVASALKLADSMRTIARASRRRRARWRFGAGGPTSSAGTSADGNPVCAVDLEVDRLLHERLARSLPDAGWLSEETADDAARLARARVWVVDPIDGTRDYVRGREGCGLDRLGRAGARGDRRARRARRATSVWRAVAGRGAWRNGERLRAPDRGDLLGARVPADALAKADRGSFTPVFKPNSIALRIAMVAAGEADLVATLRWGNEWDIAAAALIASEAGARVTDALGRPLAFNQPSRARSACSRPRPRSTMRRWRGLRSARAPRWPPRRPGERTRRL